MFQWRQLIGPLVHSKKKTLNGDIASIFGHIMALLIVRLANQPPEGEGAVGHLALPQITLMSAAVCLLSQ